VRRKTRVALKLSAHSASMALQMLLEEGKIAAGDIARALQRREKLIREMRARLAALESASAPAARRLAAAGRKAVRRAAPKARKAITRAQRIARQAQGRYLAAIRTLSQDARAKIREIRKQSGVNAAIKAARSASK
jgi:ABC-type transporter Mla subunit MlaD